MKNYIGFVNDHSGSMSSLRNAAIKDYNGMITSIKDAANAEMLDTVVSTVAIGLDTAPVERQVMVSNPHVLRPVTRWDAHGQTPLWDGIGDLIELFEELPDYSRDDVSFLIITTTDGGENGSRKYNERTLAKKIADLAKSDRWTFVFRVPKGTKRRLVGLGIPDANIQEWDTTQAGMEKSSVQTQAAVSSYFTARASGARSSSAFYSDASKVDISALTDISKEVSLYVVPVADMGIEIRPFVLKHRQEYLKGSAFYQLTKLEAKVAHDKLIAIRARNTGKIFSGPEARKMIGLPSDRNARLHPGDHKDYDIFIQSSSVNRKLVGGTGVLYWKAIGVPFTEADLAYLQPKVIAGVAPAKPAPVALPAVNGLVTGGKSPIPVTPRFPTIDNKRVRFFDSRDDARKVGSAKDVKNYVGKAATNLPAGKRWFIFD